MQAFTLNTFFSLGRRHRIPGWLRVFIILAALLGVLLLFPRTAHSEASLKSIIEMDLEEIRQIGALQLLLALSREVDGEDQVPFLRREIYHRVIATGVRLGSHGSPARVLVELKTEVFDNMGLRTLAMDSDGNALDLLLADRVLRNRVGNAFSVGLILLGIGERMAQRVELKPVALGGDLALYAPGAGKFLVVGLGQLVAEGDLSALGPSRKPLVLLDRPAFNARLLVLLGEALAREDPPRSRKLLDRALEVDPNSREARLALAKEAARRRDIAVARNHLEAVLSRAPHDAEALSLRGLLRQSAGDASGAEKDLKRSFEGGNRHAEGLFTLGEMRARRGDYDGAREVYEAARERLKSGSGLRRAGTELRELSVRGSIERLDRSPRYAERFDAAKRLLRSPTPRALASLIRALDDSNLRFKHFVWRILRLSTGESMPPQKEMWEGWWQEKFPEG